MAALIKDHPSAPSRLNKKEEELYVYSKVQMKWIEPSTVVGLTGTMITVQTLNGIK